MSRSTRGSAWKKLRGKMFTPFWISLCTLNLKCRVSLVCHKVSSTISISRCNSPISSALRHNSRRGNNSRILRCDTSTAWRCTSVGCAVKTGLTCVWFNTSCTTSCATCSACSLRTVSAMLPSCAALPFCSCTKRRRSWCTSSAMFKICAKMPTAVIKFSVCSSDKLGNSSVIILLLSCAFAKIFSALTTISSAWFSNTAYSDAVINSASASNSASLGLFNRESCMAGFR